MAKKLNLTGLEYFLSKLKAIFAGKDDIPSKVSDLTNDSGFQTNAQVQAAINTAVSGFTNIEYQVVSSLPSTGQKGVIYLKTNGGSGTSRYDEYIYVNDRFEFMGPVEVDMTNYWSKTDLVAITTSEIDSLFA